MRSSMTSCGKVMSACLVLAVVGCSSPQVTHPAYPPPGKTVTILVPYPAGGSGDILGRAIGEVLARQLPGTSSSRTSPAVRKPLHRSGSRAPRPTATRSWSAR